MMLRPRRLRDDEIVGHEAVPALDEIQHALGLADAALADEQQPDAEYVGERPVQVGRRREFVFEPRLEAVVELVGLEVRANERDARCRGEVEQIRTRLLPFRDEHARNREGEELAQVLLADRRVHRLEIRDLGLAEHLQSLRGKPRRVAGEHEARTRRVRILDHPIESVRSVDVLELERVLEALEQPPDGERLHRAPPAITRWRWASV